jgi:hypothetical protein
MNNNAESRIRYDFSGIKKRGLPKQTERKRKKRHTPTNTARKTKKIALKNPRL